ncbi:MAG: hypothetical protein ABI321_09460 [Polyangia bacterium]
MKQGTGKSIARWLIALGMMISGVLHFVITAAYASIVPAYLPGHTLLVWISGVAELLGGVGLLVPSLAIRRAASWGLIALLVAVFPANVDMALHHLPMNGHPVAPAILWGRLPLQAVLIWLTWWCTRAPRRPGSARPR